MSVKRTEREPERQGLVCPIYFRNGEKKRKRAKMMAQNGKLSQDVGSEEGYRRQLSMHKIAAMKKTVLTVAVVAAVAVGLVLFYRKEELPHL